MKVEAVKEIARSRGIHPGRRKKADLIRAIQEGERNPACFETGQASTCGQGGCLWRDDCR